MDSEDTTAKLTLYWSFMRFMFLLKHRMINAAAPYNIGAAQAMTLFIMRGDEPTSMNTLAKFFNCDASNVTNIAEKLVKAKLITRQECPTDRRIKELALTDKGKEVRACLFDSVSGIDLPGIESLSTSEKNELERLLAKSFAL